MIVCFKKLERVPNHGFPFTKCTSFITPVTGGFARRPVTRELELSFFVIFAKPQGDHPQVMAGERQVPYRNCLAVSINDGFLINVLSTIFGRMTQIEVI